MLTEKLIQEKLLNPEGKSPKKDNYKKRVCYKLCYKMQFIKYNTGMRIFSKHGSSEYRMMTYEGMILLLFSIFALICFFIDSSQQVGLQKS